MSTMTNVINALATQLQNDSVLSVYASDSGYMVENPYDLVKTKKFPFYNLFPIRTQISQIPNVDFKKMERVKYEIRIQIATSALKMKVATLGDGTRKGIYDFQEDIWQAIKQDRTLGGIVRDVALNSEITTEIVEAEDEERFYVAAAEMTIEFYDDRVVTIR